jgi:hypothetical protein
MFNLISGDSTLEIQASNSDMIQSAATITMMLHWLSTNHNLNDLVKKVFPASESKNSSKKG